MVIDWAGAFWFGTSEVVSVWDDGGVLSSHATWEGWLVGERVGEEFLGIGKFPSLAGKREIYKK